MTDPPAARRAPNALAIPMMIGASSLVAATSLLAKALGLDGEGAVGLHPFQVSAGRFAFALMTLGLFLLAVPSARPSLAGARWTLHLLRSLCGWLGITCMFTAVAQMPVGEATAISFLSPLVTVMLAALFLGESINGRKIVAMILAVAGAMLILNPGRGAFQIAGLFALAAALFIGLETIFIKKLSDREPALRVLLINNSIGAVLSLAVASLVWTWPTGWQWLLLAALGAIMVSAQALFIQSMKRGDASFVIPAFYSVLVFAAGYDFLLYGVLPRWSAFLGAALIISGALVLAFQRRAR